MSIKEKFEGFGEKARAATRGAAVFVGIALGAAILATHGLLSVSNGFFSVWIIIFLILAVGWAKDRAKRAYERALGVEDEE